MFKEWQPAHWTNGLSVRFRSVGLQTPRFALILEPFMKYMGYVDRLKSLLAESKLPNGLITAEPPLFSA